MRPPSASASRSARASRVRVQRVPVQVTYRKANGISRLVAIVTGAVAHGVSVVTALVRSRR